MATREKPKVEKERAEFKRLLAENPNYFGNVTAKSVADAFKAVKAIAGNTTYEQLHCVGLYPEQSLLEAAIEIKRTAGYGGDLCGKGTTEYVAFYIDWNDGGGFVSVGAPATVRVYDFDAVDDTPLFYAVQKAFVPKQKLPCDTPQIVQLRGILSWETVPTGPAYVPVWGNVVDVWVQIEPKQKGFIVTVLEAGTFPVLATLAPGDLEPGQPLEEAPDFHALPGADDIALVGKRADLKELIDRSVAADERPATGVEPQRHEFKKLLAKNPNHFGAISQSKDPGEILQAVMKLEPGYSALLQTYLAVNPNLLVPVELFNPKTSYEELRCVGFHPALDLLEAVIEIKRATGYKGDLCTLGSREYVGFYVDWGDGGGYQHVGTAAVRVHDIPGVENRHLHYAVRQRIANPKLRPCTIENIVRVKAILSWETPPAGPSYNPSWGNALERAIQIRPSDGLASNCDLEIVNDVHADDIAQVGASRGYAIKISGGSSVPGSWDRPFGAVVAVWGKVNVAGAVYYRFLYTTDDPSDPTASWNPILDPRRYRKTFPPGASDDRTPDGFGWFSIAEYNTDFANYPLQALVHWRTSGKTGLHHLRLELGTLFKTPLPNPCDVSLFLDNTAPELLEFGGAIPPPMPTIGVAVKDSTGAWKKCDEFQGHDQIQIWGNFRDAHFGAWSLIVFGGNIHPSGEAVPGGSGSYDPGLPGVIGATGIIGAAPNGPGKQIATLDLCPIPQMGTKVKCAYGIRLYITDRAILGYLSGYEFNTTAHGQQAFVTFDWDPNAGSTPC